MCDDLLVVAVFGLDCGSDYQAEFVFGVVCEGAGGTSSCRIGLRQVCQ